MILVIDIGNTTMEFGIYEEDSLAGVFRLGSKRDITSDEVGLFVTQYFEYKKISVENVTDVIISSVVPQLNYSVSSAVKKYFDREPLVIGENIFCNMPNLYENPKRSAQTESWILTPLSKNTAARSSSSISALLPPAKRFRKKANTWAA